MTYLSWFVRGRKYGNRVVICLSKRWIVSCTMAGCDYTLSNAGHTLSNSHQVPWWNKADNILTPKDTKTLFNIDKRQKNIPPDILFKIFDTQMGSILLYGSDKCVLTENRSLNVFSQHFVNVYDLIEAMFHMFFENLNVWLRLTDILKSIMANESRQSKPKKKSFTRAHIFIRLCQFYNILRIKSLPLCYRLQSRNIWICLSWVIYNRVEKLCQLA